MVSKITEDINQVLKVCPSCRALIPVDGMKKIISRSWGKTTKTLRCVNCIKRAALGMKAIKERSQK